MVNSVLSKSSKRVAEEPSPKEPSVDSEVPGSGDNLSGNSERGARRRRRPQPLQLGYSAAQRRTSSSSGSPKQTLPRTFISGSELTVPPHGVPLLSPPSTRHPSSSVLGNPGLFESPTTEKELTPIWVKTKFAPSLPREILVMIFQCVLSQKGTSPHQIRPTLFHLRLVCQEWRLIIERTSELWPSFHPPLKATECGSCVDWYIGVTEEVSKQVVARVVLELPNEGQGIHRDLFQHLLDLAIRTVSLKVCIASGSSRGLNDAVLMSPLIGLTTRRRPSDGPDMRHLKRVEWVMADHHFQHQLPSHLELPWSSLRQLPWAQLTHASLKLSLTLKDCIFIFGHAVMMEDMALETVSDDPSSPLEPTDKKCPHLHLRSLKIHTAVNISFLFRRYDLPQLRHLELEFLARDASTDRALPDTVPWPQLTRVALHYFSDPGTVGSIIGQLDEVEALTLKGRLWDDEIWSVRHILGSLRSFILVPLDDAAALPTISHFIQYILPTSVELIDAPLDQTTFGQMIIPSRPFSSIITAKLERHPILPGDFLSFLEHAPQIINGSFWIKDVDSSFSPSASFSPPTSPFPIPSYANTTCKMKKLKLNLDFQYISAKPFLDALVLPGLTKLTLKASKNAADCDGLYELLRRSGCPLTKLVLNCPNASGAGVLKILELLTSTLEVCEIEGDTVTSTRFGGSFFRGLTHGGMNCLCPRLERLCIWPRIDADSFYDMVRSRSNFPNDCGCQLRKLRHVEAGVVGDQVKCSEFAQWLKDRNIASKLYPIPYSE